MNNWPKIDQRHNQKHRAWLVTFGGGQRCSMVGEPVWYEEALSHAQFHWPDADVEPLTTRHTDGSMINAS